jgi:probable metal-binding protein
MSNSIHGHDVMQMMMESGTTYTVATLRAAIVQRFGADARFHTCSADNLTPDELIEFLAGRGKFTPADGGFVTGADKMCAHGDDHQH